MMFCFRIINDFRSQSRIDPFDVCHKVQAIPRGVVEHYDLKTLPPLKKLKPRSDNLAEKNKVIPPELIKQELMLKDLRNDDPRIMTQDYKGKPVPRYLYFREHGTWNSKTCNWNVNRNIMGRMIG